MAAMNTLYLLLLHDLAIQLEFRLHSNTFVISWCQNNNLAARFFRMKVTVLSNL